VAKKTEKELKAPDQFVTFWSKAGTWVGARRKAALIGLVGLLAVIAIAWGAQSYLSTRAERDSQAFGRIHRVATAALIPETGEAPKFDDELPHFKTEKERLQATLKEADDFLAAHGGGKLRDEALVLKARVLMSLDRPAEALQIYNDLAGSLDQRLRFLAQEGVAFAQEASGQNDKAMAVWDTLAAEAKSSGNFLRDRALYQKARLLEKKGAAKDAEKVYRGILTELPQSSLKDEINDRLAVLEGK
jgi:tetratricopeptide (TPR) repeat protein